MKHWRKKSRREDRVVKEGRLIVEKGKRKEGNKTERKATHT